MAERRLLKLRGMGEGYVFVDQWDVDAPMEAVFDALADATSYPQWWKPVYLEPYARRVAGLA